MGWKASSRRNGRENEEFVQGCLGLLSSEMAWSVPPMVVAVIGIVVWGFFFLENRLF